MSEIMSREDFDRGARYSVAATISTLAEALREIQRSNEDDPTIVFVVGDDSKGKLKTLRKKGWI